MTSTTPHAAAPASPAAVDAICAFFTQLAPQDVARMHTLYMPDAHFKDPFSDVHGLVAIQQVFAHMFTALEQPRFDVTTRIVDGNQCFLLLVFEFCLVRFCSGV